MFKGFGNEVRMHPRLSEAVFEFLPGEEEKGSLCWGLCWGLFWENEGIGIGPVGWF